MFKFRGRLTVGQQTLNLSMKVRFFPSEQKLIPSKNMLTVKEIQSNLKEAKLIKNKGWIVKRNIRNGNVEYNALFQNRNFIGSRKTHREAIVLAVSESFRNNTLNWNATNRWLKLMNVSLTTEEITQSSKTGIQFKGWYVVSCKNAFEIYIGRNCKNSIYFSKSSTKKKACEKAILEAKKKEFYNKLATERFLKSNNLTELLNIT